MNLSKRSTWMIVLAIVLVFAALNWQDIKRGIYDGYHQARSENK